MSAPDNIIFLPNASSQQIIVPDLSQKKIKALKKILRQCLAVLTVLSFFNKKRKSWKNSGAEALMDSIKSAT